MSSNKRNGSPEPYQQEFQPNHYCLRKTLAGAVNIEVVRIREGKSQDLRSVEAWFGADAKLDQLQETLGPDESPLRLQHVNLDSAHQGLFAAQPWIPTI
ncbi:hypothetical protein E1B28_007966 [Marasmius oreades]|uniref:Uncharacterized protein n=1 Tax=Marasmius oreades TaxID=181124 RepID=A0A9P7S316_9AGAR|nr:uncharacterized protein E1B28_007966 [Marasmius oreades]KAG7094365.1 hypothetical protein E1B28_007966 [Marasmius oreades]